MSVARVTYTTVALFRVGRIDTAGVAVTAHSQLCTHIHCCDTFERVGDRLAINLTLMILCFSSIAECGLN